MMALTMRNIVYGQVVHGIGKLIMGYHALKTLLVEQVVITCLAANLIERCIVWNHSVYGQKRRAAIKILVSMLKNIIILQSRNVQIGVFKMADLFATWTIVKCVMDA